MMPWRKTTNVPVVAKSRRALKSVGSCSTVIPSLASMGWILSGCVRICQHDGELRSQQTQCGILAPRGHRHEGRSRVRGRGGQRLYPRHVSTSGRHQDLPRDRLRHRRRSVIGGRPHLGRPRVFSAKPVKRRNGFWASTSPWTDAPRYGVL